MIINIALIMLIAFIELSNYKERAKLLDRIQAKDLSEYKALNQENKKELVKAENKEIDFL
jgi:hypothetical protein